MERQYQYVYFAIKTKGFVSNFLTKPVALAGDENLVKLVSAVSSLLRQLLVTLLIGSCFLVFQLVRLDNLFAYWNVNSVQFSDRSADEALVSHAVFLSYRAFLETLGAVLAGQSLLLWNRTVSDLHGLNSLSFFRSLAIILTVKFG